MLVEVYHYPEDSNTDVTVIGKTSVSDIPLPVLQILQFKY